MASPLRLVALLLLATQPRRLMTSALSLWRPLPHVERRAVLAAGGATFLASDSAAASARAAPLPPPSGVTTPPRGPRRPGPRSVVSVESPPAIPVWPTWGGGRVVPASLGGVLQDPFLLLAHHKHWFDPRDPLRKPFMAVGKSLGLPYVDVEGFEMHPHRGFDIFTYVLDGSDGFRHGDSLGEDERVYRGGTAQWMRTGSGALHEEFWETRPDRRTDIELFQLWVNLGREQKMDPPAIRYLGRDSASTDWIERTIEHGGSGVGWVRDLTSTLQASLDAEDWDGEGSVVRPRPPLEVLHVKLDRGGAEFNLETNLNAVIYVREGTARVRNSAGEDVSVQALQTATFSHDGSSIGIRSGDRAPVDFLLLAALPLGEPIAQGGPIVMNTRGEINDAYRQLQEGTFLDREHVLRQHRRRHRA